MKLLLQLFAITYLILFWNDSFATVLTKEVTYYADAFEGGWTSNGEIFSQSGFTAAMCDIALGKNIYVFSANTGAVVRVNDRPNCTRYPNILDLTKRVFSLFAPTSAGRISGIQVNTLDSLDSEIFESLGIILTGITPTVYFTWDGVEFWGRVTNGKKSVFVFLQNETTKEEYSTLVPVTSGQVFRAWMTLPRSPGKYVLVIAAGNNFETKDVGRITLIDKGILSSSSEFPQKDIWLVPKVEQIGDTASISLGDNIWGNLQITQDTKVFQTSGTRFLFDSLSQYRPGRASAQIDGYVIGSGWSLDRLARIPSIFSGTVLLDRTHEKIGQNIAIIRNYKTYTTVKFRVPSNIQIRSSYYLTLPNGDIRDFDFPSPFVSTGGEYLIPGKTVMVSFPTPDEGTYLIEIVTSRGLAYINLPVVRWRVWNIIKPYSKESTLNIRKNKDTVKKYQLARINILRASLGRGLLVEDELLSRIAQAKADDMIARKYTEHRDPDGNYIRDFAKMRNMNYSGSLGENIAYGNVSDIVLQDGLEESGTHRHAMLNPEFQKVGFWYGINNGYVYMVQVFWDQ